MEFIFLDICGFLGYVISCERNVTSLNDGRLYSGLEKLSVYLNLLVRLYVLLKFEVLTHVTMKTTSFGIYLDDGNSRLL
jgi:hypothetical protein